MVAHEIKNISSEELKFLLRNTTVAGMKRFLVSFDPLFVRILKLLGKEGIVRWFADCTENDFNYFKEYIPGKGTRYLDIGCGSGDTSYYIFQKTGAITHCLDVTDKAISPEIKKLSGTVDGFSFRTYQAGDPMPFTDNSIDVASMFYVLHHCSTRTQALELLIDAKRIIKNGGYLLIIEEPIRNEDERKVKDAMDVYANALFHAGAVEKSHFYYEPDLLDQFNTAGYTDVKKIKIKEWSWLMPRNLYVLKVSKG